MKRILLVSITLLLILSGCGSNIMSGYKNLGKNHQFETKEYQSIVDDMIEKTPGVYYIGFPDCPWCQALVPHLNQALVEHDLKAQYINVKTPQFENNEALTKQYLEFIKTFEDGKANNGASPFLIVIDNDGIIKGHSGTAPSHDARKNEMTEAEVEFLNLRLNTMLDRLN